MQWIWGLQSSCQIFVEGMEKAKFNREYPPSPKALAHLEITGIEAYQASVTVCEIAVEKKRLPLPLEEHPDGNKDPERLKSLHRYPDQVQVINRVSRPHEYFSAIDSAGEYKQTRVMSRSISAEGLYQLGAFQVTAAQVLLRPNVGCDFSQTLVVPENIKMEDLLKVVSNNFQGRFRSYERISSQKWNGSCGDSVICSAEDAFRCLDFSAGSVFNP
jgi:hypothetical protein